MSAPREPVIPLSVQAKQRIRIAGTIAQKPLGSAFIASLKEITLRQIRYITLNTTATAEPRARPAEASQLLKASIKVSPSKNPPV